MHAGKFLAALRAGTGEPLNAGDFCEFRPKLLAAPFWLVLGLTKSGDNQLSPLLYRRWLEMCNSEASSKVSGLS